MKRVALWLGVIAAAGCSTANQHTNVCAAGGAGCRAHADAVVAQLFLVGDAGEANPERIAMFRALRSDLEAAPQGRARLLFLGDNVYESGLRVWDAGHRDCGEARDGWCAEDVEQLEGQLELADAGVPAVFLSGNHDWGNQAGARGLRRLSNQADYVETAARGGRQVSFLPAAGCMGPELDSLVVDGLPVLRLVYLDTHLLLQQKDAPEPPKRCRARTPRQTYDAVRDALAAARGEGLPVVIAVHHPLRTGGSHGGNKSGAEELLANSGLMVQDVMSRRYAEMILRLREIISTLEPDSFAPVIFAAGHDHNLQVIDDDELHGELFHLVSGSGSKTLGVVPLPETRLAVDLVGYMRLDLHSGGGATVVVRALCPEESDPAAISCYGKRGLTTIYEAALY